MVENAQKALRKATAVGTEQDGLTGGCSFMPRPAECLCIERFAHVDRKLVVGGKLVEMWERRLQPWISGLDVQALAFYVRSRPVI